MKMLWFAATIVVLSLASLEVAAATSTLKGSNQIEQVRKVVPQVKPNLAPPPIVTNWSPRERAYPGSRMRISAQDIDIGNFVIQLGDGKNAVRLGNLRRYRSYIEATIPQSYTGRRGAPLIVYHRNSERRVLDPDYQVLNRQAVFSGTSAWHDTENLASSIWTEGQVAIRLDRLEFSSSGSGTYQETTPLLRLTGQTVEPCKEGGTKGSQIVKEFAFQTARSNKPIRWRRLPDGRIELRSIGVAHGEQPEVVARAFVNDTVLTLEYLESTTGMPIKAGLVKEICQLRGAFDVLPQVIVPEPAQTRSHIVEWSLQRKDAL